MMVLAMVATVLRLGSPFADGMVLQRDTSLPVWGSATPGAEVTVSFAGKSRTAKAGTNGAWRVDLPPLPASRVGRDLIVTANPTIQQSNNQTTLRDILVGEVWYASGQSNMELPVAGDNPHFRDAEGALLSQFLRRDDVRICNAWDESDDRWRAAPLAYLPQEVVWERLSPEALKPKHLAWKTNRQSVSALAVYFAKEIRDALDVPVGIVCSYVGGSGIDSWIPRGGYAGVRGLEEYDSYVTVAENFKSDLKRFRCIWGPDSQPSALFNRMVAPLSPLAIRGVIWYQGCTNNGEYDLYVSKMHALTRGWRRWFENPKLPFYYVQIASWTGYEKKKNQLGLQMAQAQFEREDAHSAMVVSADVGNPNDIHPNGKGVIARRLAARALKREYGFSTVKDDSPRVASVSRSNDVVRITFANAGALTVFASDFSTNTCFSLAGRDRRFVPAFVRNLRPFPRENGSVEYRGDVDGSFVELFAPGVRAPTHVRYDITDWTSGRLYNEVALPLGPFECAVPDAAPLHAAGAVPPYRDPSLPVAERVQDLIARMTPQEKCAQLGNVMGFRAYIDGGAAFADGFEKAFVTNPPGQVYGLFRSDWWTKRDWQRGILPEKAVETLNRFQRLAVEKTRLGIPLLFVEEAPHGLMALGEPVFPTGLGLGATFDTNLTERIGREVGRAARARGVRSVYGPIVDLARDPRWGRCEECFGADPEHVTQMAEAEWRGLHAAGIEPCLKHFVGGGAAEGGHNIRTAHLGLNELNNVHLRPFRRIIAGGARQVMCTYHDVDGEHCASSPFLLDEVLRRQLGFKGFVCSDAGATALAWHHRMCGSAAAAFARALKAGCDTEFDGESPSAAGREFRQALEAGLVDGRDLDRALERFLSVKFELGLFEHPYADPKEAYARNRDLALEAAVKSLVLVKNEGTLPLKKGAVSSLAVIGPNAGDRIMNPLGDYTAPQRAEDVVTVLDGIRGLAGDTARVDFALGCRVRNPSRAGFAEACRAASAADVTVLVLGASSSPYGKVSQDDSMAGATVVTGDEDPDNDKDSGEGCDRSSLELSGVQTELFEAVRAKTRKLVVVVIAGRPLVLNKILERADAVLIGWYPGSRGGEAIAKALFGEVNPSGRLPVAIPRTVGQLPVTPDAVTEHRSQYVDGSGDPALPFGFGLSYTTFSYGDLAVKRTDDGGAVLSVEVTNTGTRAGEEVVSFFVTHKAGVIQRPYRELVAFERVSLEPRERKVVSARVSRLVLGRYDGGGRWIAPEGEMDFHTGFNR